MKYFIYILIFPLITLAQNTPSVRTVKGFTYSASGRLPLSGVSIVSKRTGNTAFSDINGKFSVLADIKSDTLVVTHIGYKSKEVRIVKNNIEIEVLLDDEVTDLKEVNISTGYQSIPKERSTGSFSIVDNKTFNEQSGKDILSRLEAVANGISVDRYTGSTSGPSTIMIRGQSTILGVKGPLIVVDNFPYNGDINNINPNDVENITILKDAAAASIWGTKAGNGVIVITTKKGKFNKAVNINFNSFISFTDKPDLFLIKQISSSDFIDVEQFLFSKKYKFTDTSNRNRPSFSPVYEILFRQMKGELSADAAKAQIDAHRNHDYRNDLTNHFYQKAISQQYSLNASGGTNNFSWLFSSGYDKNINELSAKSDRLNLQLSNTYRPIQNLTFNSSIYLTFSGSKNGKPGYGRLTTANGSLPPYTQLVGLDGEAVPVMKDYRHVFLDKIANGKLLDWNYYPLTDYENIDTKNRVDDLMGNFGVNYKFYSDLSIDIKYQYERQKTEGRTIYGIDSYTARNLINRFTKIDPITGALDYKIPRGAIADLSENTTESHQLRGQLNYDKVWGKHAITAIAGSELRHSENPSSAFRAYGYDPSTLGISNVDFVSSIPVVIPVGTTAKIPNIAGLENRVNRFVSLYSNAAYTYNNKYTFSASARRDASNLFGVNTNDKWTPLWSAGLGYDISKESFYHFSALPYLKLRGSYGVSGNADPSRVALTTISYSPFSNYDTGTQYAYIDRYGNPELKWEKIRTLNIGLDFESKNRRIAGSLEVYQKKGTDLFGPTQMDNTTGITSGLVKNVAAMKAKGLDVTLSTLNLTGNVQWRTTANFSLNRDKVTEYYQNIPRGSDYVSGSPLISAILEKPIYSVFSFKWMGLDPATGDPLSYINGHTSKNYTAILGDSTKISDLIFHGSAFPTMFGSIGNDFSWKGFSLSVRVVYKLGYYFRRPSLSYSSLFSLRTGHAEFADRWQKAGDENKTNVPSMIYPAIQNRDILYNGAEINVEKADHIRLQYITLGYDFTKLNIKRLALNTLQVYVNLNNLGILWKANKQGIDPEYASAQNVAPSKTVTFGIRTTF